MSPQQKGYTLIEMVMIILLFSLAISGVKLGDRRSKELAFESKVEEVISGIEYIKHRAVLTGKLCSMYCLEDKLLFKKEQDETVFKVCMSDGQRVNRKNMGSDKYLLRFNGTMAPAAAATLIIEEVNLKKRARITIGVATGKIRVYYEKL